MTAHFDTFQESCKSVQASDDARSQNVVAPCCETLNINSFYASVCFWIFFTLIAALLVLNVIPDYPRLYFTGSLLYILVTNRTNQVSL